MVIDDGRNKENTVCVTGVEVGKWAILHKLLTS